MNKTKFSTSTSRIRLANVEDVDKYIELLNDNYIASEVLGRVITCYTTKPQVCNILENATAEFQLHAHTEVTKISGIRPIEIRMPDDYTINDMIEHLKAHGHMESD